MGPPDDGVVARDEADPVGDPAPDGRVDVSEGAYAPDSDSCVEVGRVPGMNRDADAGVYAVSP